MLPYIQLGGIHIFEQRRASCLRADPLGFAKGTLNRELVGDTSEDELLGALEAYIVVALSAHKDMA